MHLLRSTADVDTEKPDERSIITYVSALYEKLESAQEERNGSAAPPAKTTPKDDKPTKSVSPALKKEQRPVSPTAGKGEKAKQPTARAGPSTGGKRTPSPVNLGKHSRTPSPSAPVGGVSAARRGSRSPSPTAKAAPAKKPKVGTKATPLDQDGRLKGKRANGGRKRSSTAGAGNGAAGSPMEVEFSESEDDESEVWNPFTPKSDQCQNSPAASPEILHRTVWRTRLFIAYSR